MPHAGGRGVAGVLIVNADDWGRDRATTASIVSCIERGAVSSVSAMVFMEDSERAARLAGERGIDTGLHLNFSTGFSAPRCPADLQARQASLGAYLLRHRFAQVIFHPGLARAFEYVVRAQIEEYRRLYGFAPNRLDGHHHMHLCANVVGQRLLPADTIVRRSFSFQAGEKSLLNRLYRRVLDRVLAGSHRLADRFYSLSPLEPRARLQAIVSAAQLAVVEVAAHPAVPSEYAFLSSGEAREWAGDVGIASRYAL